MLLQIKDRELFNKAKKLYEESQFSKALLILKKLYEIYPKNEDVLYLMGNIFYFEGDLKNAQMAYKMILDANPEHTDASIGLSILLNDIGQYDQAKTIFENTRARVKKSNNFNEGHDQHINKQLSAKHYELAESYFSFERHDEALKEYQKAYQLDNDLLVARVKVAKILAKKGLIAKAIEELKKLKNEHPEYLESRLALGILYFGQGHVIEAQTEWQRILEKSPQNPEAQMYLNLSFNASETQI